MNSVLRKNCLWPLTAERSKGPRTVRSQSDRTKAGEVRQLRVRSDTGSCRIFFSFSVFFLLHRGRGAERWLSA